MGCRLQLNLVNKYRAFLCRHLACIWWSIIEAIEKRSEQSIRQDLGMMEEDSFVNNDVGEEVVVANGGDGEGVGGMARSDDGGDGGGGNVVQDPPLSLGEVRGILEQNHTLIQEISQNHKARDADRLTRNVALIRDLNTNIARVVDLYANLTGSSHSHTTSDVASATNTNATNSSSPSAAAATAEVSKQPHTTDTDAK
uniref:Protein EARLY FLOWERING 4 domain-containing protein n=2 Tax=Oryza glaberrima TaxID=4538 RepID=I1QI44_ORYGL